MDSGAYQPKLLYALAGALVALLLSLAALQYHWLGAVSQGERERMQANLNASLKQFARDFDRELTRLFLAFQTGDGVPATPDQFATRYQAWRANAPDVRLVSAVYGLERDAGVNWQLTCYQPNAAFVPCAWPDSLKNWRARWENPPALASEVRRIVSKNGATETVDLAGMLPLEQGLADPYIPALIIPADNRLSGPPTLPLAYRKCFILALDRAYIQQELIPRLARKHGLGGATGDYRLTVLNNGDGKQVIYQAENSDATAPGDASAPLFTILFDEFDQLAPKTANAENPPRAKTERHVTINVFQGNTEIRESGPPSLLAAKFDNQAGWRAVAQHRAGSLDVAVAQARRRNLALSAAILVLLGVSLALLARVSQRAQLLAARQMEFVAGVSHELRTPLAVICSAAENLADGVVERPAQIQRYGTLIRDEGRRLGNMVEQVLEFAGAQSGRQVYELRRVAVADVVSDALTPYRQQLEAENWLLETDLPADLPPVQADAPALARALQNLVSNALKYSNGERWLRVAARREGAWVAFSVADKGRGIPAHELRHIFEPFTRGRAVVAEQIHGNGLGLSLVKHIAEAHGGRVEVASQVQQGSTFTLYVPAASTIQSLKTAI